MRAARLVAPILICSLTTLIGACGDDDDDDTARIDGGGVTIDGGPNDPDGGGIDAGPSYSATLSAVEIKVVGVPSVGEGLQIGIDYKQDGVGGSTVLADESPGPTGCIATERLAGAAGNPDLNAGTLAITAMDSTPLIPVCAWVDDTTTPNNDDYRCVASAGAAEVVGGATGMAGLALLDATTNSYGMEDVGRYVVITGATNAANNGAFPIVNYNAGADALVYANPGAVAEAASPAMFTILAGQGPIPGTSGDGYLENDDSITFTLTPGEGSLFDLDPITVSAGDAFALTSESATALTSIAVGGTDAAEDLVLGCDAEEDGCVAASAQAQIITIDTTDGSTAGISPFSMPAPTTKAISVRCVHIVTNLASAQSATVPAAYMEYIKDSGATRVRTSFVRADLGLVTGMNVAVGHGYLAFTNPPLPE